MAYHLNQETGRPNLCKAKPGNCPLDKGKKNSEITPHFNSKEDARAYYEESKSSGTIVSMKKQSVNQQLVKKLGVDEEYLDSLGASTEAKNSAKVILDLMGDNAREPDYIGDFKGGGLRLHWNEIGWDGGKSTTQYVVVDRAGRSSKFEIVKDGTNMSRIPLETHELKRKIQGKEKPVVPVKELFDEARNRVRPELVKDFQRLEDNLDYHLRNGSNGKARGAATRAIVLADGMWVSDWNNNEREAGESARLKFQNGIDDLVKQKTGKSITYDDTEQGSRQVLADQLAINTSFYPRREYGIEYDDFVRQPSEETYTELMRSVDKYCARNEVKEPLTNMLRSFGERSYIDQKPGAWLLVKEVESAEQAWKNKFSEVQFGS